MRVAQSLAALPSAFDTGKLQTVSNQQVTRHRLGSERSGQSWYSVFDFGDVTFVFVKYEFAFLNAESRQSGHSSLPFSLPWEARYELAK
jgi:hypothetical protein